ncbi:non-ribosomal peptide synthetase [Streptomyces lunaelactis]|uniref:non-ribosomal peptide synthetase n=1 Tax=Streptomyces lunaelactis TaxID=1535768 RepID=UPI0015854DD1|nr:non-ribosomal peptide synthetase [Streptomyces lunaelactis]NUK18884.1 amino acid adenylation domain-containing protein [Streptomyces lunaelactis]
MNHDPIQDAAAPVWPPVLLPTDRPRRPGVPSRCSAVETAVLDVPAADDVLTAAFAALLYRYTAQDRIGFARTGSDAGDVRFQVTGESTLRELADAGDAGRTPPAGTGPVAIRFAADGEPADGERSGTEAPFELQLVLRGPGALELHYDAELFDRATAARLLGHYRTLLTDGLTFPVRPVSHLQLLTDAELRRTLIEWNETKTVLPHEICLHEAFEAQAALAPEETAVVHGTERHTYGQINGAANRLAHHLRSLGVGPDVRVGLCLDRSPELLISVLGILKAGGAYVPLDPEYPAQRIAAMVEGTSCAVMISCEELTANLPGGGDDRSRHLLLLDRDAGALSTQPEHNPGTIAGPDHLCYIIHTSGSTGAPKPIALRHRGVMNNLADLNSRFQVGPGDSVLSLSSPSFDMSVYEFLGITVAGGAVVIPAAGRAKDPAHWAELLAEEGVTVWNSAPALLELLVDQLEQTGAGPLPRLRLALLGGDWVPVNLPDRVQDIAPGLRFIAMGGATEASIHSTIYEVEATDPGWTSIPYGRPMANQRTFILDNDLQPVPPGVPGELYLAGVGLARGYLDQPERTAERFIEFSHGDVRGERLYRTGDLARFGTDGLIELLGRMDFQVKINGLRVELGEIEAVLRSHPGVQQTAVIAREGRLVAYVVPAGRDGVAVDALRSLAADRLPEYMVPKAFVTLERLPLTPNGKLDRKGLPEPEFTGAEYRAPGTADEEILAGVYAEVLGVERVGIDDDFIALGGDSIRSIQVVTRARARGIEVTPRQILQCRTVAELALAASGTDAAAETGEDTSAPLVTVSQDDMEAFRQRYPRLADVWPLTAMQSGMLFESMLSDTGDDAYQMQTVYHLSGHVDAARMRAVGQALLERYANLRAAFVSDAAGNLVQIVVDGVELPWREIDLSDLADAERDDAFGRFLAEDQAVRFDLAAPPLLRLALVRLSPERSELVVTAHHVLIDGWSEQVLAEDLLRLYASGGDASELPPVRGFRDFLAWLARQDQEESARAWADELAGVDGPTTLVPATAPRAEAAGIGEVALALTPEESRQLAGRGAELGVTVNTLVQGAWAVVLSALTGRDDVVFGAAVSGRPGALSGVESMVGLFINTLPVRARCAPGDTLAGLLKGLQSRQTALLDHHHHSLSEIHQATGFDALFDTLVAFQSYPADDAGIAEATAAAGIEVTGIDSVGGANYPLALIVEDGRLTLQYHRNLFEQGTAEDIAARFRSVLRQLAADTGRRIGTVDVLLPAERDRILGEYNDTAADTPAETVAALVERQAAATPDAAAVIFEGTALTYGELNTRANRLAHALIRRGMGPESVVALALPRSADLAVALLGTLKTGAAYVLISPEYSQRQRDAVLMEAAPELILASEDAAPDLALTSPLVRLDELDLGAGPDTDPGDQDRNAPVRPQQLACVRYLPGAPNGVAISQRALANGVLGFAAGAGLAPGTRMLAGSPHGDAAVFEILTALSAGAGAEVVQDVLALGGQGGWSGDVISTTAPLFAGLLNRPTGTIRAATVVFTGDVLLGSLVQRVRAAIPGVRVVSTYGPTETIRATALTAAEGWTGEGSAPLGSVLGNMRAYVLGPALQLLPAGVTGELYVAGEVARGYHGRAGLTAQRFLADPYGKPGSRMYRTGDLARWNSAGSLEYVGRRGEQAKVRGHRFQAGDVEAVLAAHPAVSQAAVVAREDGGEQLTGYVAALRNGAGVGAEELREFVAQRLPEYMVPTAFVTLEELPAAADGTVDRDALPEPGAESAGGGYRAGRTPQEEALCELFAEVLGVDRVGIDDSFFTLGGNSLKATRLIGRMRRTLGIEASIRTIFQYSTIAELSGQVEATATKSRPRLRKMTKE